MKCLEFSTKPNIVKKKDLNFVLFKLNFPVPRELDKLIYVDLLNRIINTTNNSFPKSEEHEKELKRKLITSLRLHGYTANNNSYLCYQFSIPKEDIINDYDFEESFKYAIYNLYNPYIINDAFDQERFNYINNSLIERLKESEINIYDKNYHYFIKVIDPKEEYVLSYDTRLKLLEKADPKELYNLYKEYILNNHFFSMVFGDVSKKRINDLFNKYVPQAEKSFKINSNNYKFKKLLKYKEINKKTSFNQTEINMIYQVRNLKSEEDHLFRILHFILVSNDINLLMKKLRKELNLVYHVTLDRYFSLGIYNIQIYTRLKDKDKAIAAVKEIFESLKNRKTIAKYMKQILTLLKNNLYKKEDDPYNKLDLAHDKIINIRNNKELIEIYKNTEIDDIISFINRIELTQIITFEGVDE